MAKESGIGMTLTIDTSGGSGQAITDDVTNLSLSTTRNLQDVTGLADTTVERLPLLADGSAQVNGVFDDASNMEHDIFKNIATNTASRTVVAAHSGQTLTMEMYFTDYALSRGQDGSLTFSAPASLANSTSYGWS
mgnify:FL=1